MIRFCVAQNSYCALRASKIEIVGRRTLTVLDMWLETDLVVAGVQLCISMR